MTCAALAAPSLLVHAVRGALWRNAPLPATHTAATRAPPPPPPTHPHAHTPCSPEYMEANCPDSCGLCTAGGGGGGEDSCENIDPDEDCEAWAWQDDYCYDDKL